MSDGGEIPVEVHDVSGRRRPITVRAERGKVIMTNPNPGTAVLDPRTEVEQLKNALDVAVVQALGQPRDEP